MMLPEAIALISAFKTPFLGLFKDLKDEVLYFIDSGLSDYVSCIFNKYAFTKTFLYRNEKVGFYDVFFPVSLQIRKNIIKINHLSEIFKDSRYVTLIGNAGSGKTMLLKHFFLNSVKTIYKIPIVFELRSLNEAHGSFEETIFRTITNNKLSPNVKILERLLDSGEFIFLLDGFDEIFSKQKERIIFEIDSFIDRYSKNSFLITSRPGSGIESMPRFDNYYVQPLSEEEIISFIDLQLNDSEDKRLGEKIKNVIKKKENMDYKNFLDSPLLLSMFILTFNSYPELPKKKSKFYWNVFDTLATKHDSFTKKGGFMHERKTNLQNEDFEEVLKWLAYISLFEGHYTFDSEYLSRKLNEIKTLLKFSYNTQELIEDLTLAISIIIVDGVDYKFPHKSLQEYFCASLIKDLSPENKEKIYKEKFTHHIRKTFGGNENFWNLCYELDGKYFTEHVLIYNLDCFLDLTQNKDLIGKIREIYKFFEYSDRAIIKNNKISINGNSRTVTLFLVVSEYLNIYAHNELSFSNAIFSHYDEIKSLFIDKRKIRIEKERDGKEYHSLTYHSNWDSKIESIVLNSEIKNQIISYIEKVEIKRNELYAELKDSNISTLNLLNI